ncbi:tetratricopeptide repeat protein, partial [Acinetobacter baumannii]
DEAAKVINEALQKDPNYVRGYYQLAKIYQHNGDDKKFREMLSKVNELDPDDEGLKFERKINPTIE